MNPLDNFTSLAFALTAALAGAAEPPVRDFTLDDHTVYAVPVSGTRVTTISFPSPIAAIDGALITADGKTPGLFQIAHTKGTAYLSVRALAKEAATNLNVRWNNRTYVFELRESAVPLYSVVLQTKPEKSRLHAHALTPPRLLGLLDTAKAFALLKTYHPEAVRGVEYRDLREKPSVSDCGDYEVRCEQAFRFPEEDTLVFQITIANRGDKPLEHAPERLEVRAGDRVITPSLTDLSAIVAPRGTVSGYVVLSGGPDGRRSDLSLKNDFTFVLSRRDAKADASDWDVDPLQPIDLPKK